MANFSYTDSLQVKISQKVLGWGLLFLTHTVEQQLVVSAVMMTSCRLVDSHHVSHQVRLLRTHHYQTVITASSELYSYLSSSL